MLPLSPRTTAPVSTVLRVRFQVGGGRNVYRAAVPVQGDRPALALRPELEGDLLALGIGVALGLGVVVRRLRDDRVRRAEVQGPEHRVDDVAHPIAHRAVAEGDPAAPRVVAVGGAVGPELRRAQPQVPIERVGHLVLLLELPERVDAGVHRVQPQWMVWTLPIAPSQIHSQNMRMVSEECPWLPNCVTTLCSLAAFISWRTS